MENKSRKGTKISRRGMLPLLGGSLLIPFLGFSNSEKDIVSTSKDETYQTLLKPDGTTVKVKTDTLKKSKVLKKNISNTSLLSWISKKL
ncbi:hypothetical protein [Changchengzhania lutea]|uniref:hypothetical protein n=1 Tax=Changchengzhania lutea TaxID=2049305 RepID=UPI00115C48C1|nr:hypothetical protein [Changchengzhania lutea]